MIFSASEEVPAGLLERFGRILEPSLRQPFSPDGLWIVRPDGYVGLSAKAGDWTAVSTYLNNIVGKGRAI